jgi:endonuclease YncB( thermonuclease family)
MKLCLIAGCALLLTIAAAPAGAKPILYWSDADSGVLNGQRFRLYSLDAPETGPLSRRGGAKCELERQRGFEAKAKMVEMTKGADVRISKSYGYDRSEKPRLLVDLIVDGKDLGQAGIDAGILARWPHRGTKKLSPKPDWCS